MNTYAFARVVHILGVVFWIGGVAMVTTVLLPALRRTGEAGERVPLFERIENRFALQSRISTLAVGLSGLYMLYRMDGWHLFARPGYWWLHAMVVVWAVFTLMLFVLEPLVLHRWFEERARRRPESTFALIQRMHWLLLLVSLVTVAGAAAGAHGWFLFNP